MKNSDWKEVRLGELITEYGGVIQTGPFGSQLHEADYKDEGIPVVMPKDIIEGKIDETKTSKIDYETFDRLKRHRLNVGDVLLPRRGDFNKRAIVTEKEAGWICGTGCLKISVSPKVLNPLFLFYYFTQKGVVEYIESQAVGTTMLNLSGSIVSKFTIPLPPLPTQQKIADTLGAYDELIENNRRRIALLENMAAGLYKEWFVRMRPYGQTLPKNVETGLPEGWEVKKLGEVVEFKYGKSLLDEARQGGEYPVYGSSGIVGYHDSYLVSGNRVIIGRKGNVGSIFWSYLPFYPIDTVYYAQSALSMYYLFFNLKSQNFISSDSAVPGLNREQALSNLIIIPDQNTLTQFEEIAILIFNQIKTLQEQTGVLRRVRDRLLPRLMSGELGG